MKDEPLSQLKSDLEELLKVKKKIYAHLDFKYIGFEQLILDCGTAMEAKLLPANIKRGLPKSCYYNCQKLAFEKEDFIYVEGYALMDDPLFTTAHAWLLTPYGDAIDPTWETPGDAYLGIPLSTEWIRLFLESRKQRGRENDISIFESNYLESWSLLKEGLPPEAYFRQ